MPRFFLASATAATLLTGIAAPLAAGPISNLSECYAAVINWCESEFPHADCSQASGLDECDEVFGDSAAGVIGFLQTRPNEPTARLVLTSAPTERPQRAGSEDGDSARDTGRDTGRDTAGRPTR